MNYRPGAHRHMKIPYIWRQHRQQRFPRRKKQPETSVPALANRNPSAMSQQRPRVLAIGKTYH